MWYFPSLIDMLATSQPDHVLFEKDGVALTTAGFVDAVDGLVEHFSAKAPADDSVILVSDKSVLLLPAIVAAAITGKTYAPVSPDIPPARLDAIKSALDVEQVFDLAALESSIGHSQGNGSYDERLAHLGKLLASTEPLSPDKPVYVLFTSGSTGQPKGVMIGERSVKFFTGWAFAEFGFSREDVLIAQVPETFDLSVLDIYACLTFGCKLVAISKTVGSDPGEVIARIRQHGATSIFSTPSFFNLLALDRHFDAESLPSLRQFLLCGEVFQKTLAKKLGRKFPNVGIHNLYGPTEATVAVTSVKVTDELLAEDGPLPIGRPMGDMECVFLDEDSRPANGNVGEMAFTGDTVGIGYVKMPEKSAEVFVELANSRGETVPAYRTGDIGELAENGFLYYRGRRDHQIKWSGYRIEIGEIEHQLNDVSFVEAAAILPARLANGDVAALIAYVVVHEGHEDEEALNAEISKYLPHYMLPSAYKFIGDMPMTAHGKIDRKALELEHEKLRRS